MPDFYFTNKSIPKKDILNSALDLSKEEKSLSPLKYLTNSEIGKVFKKGQSLGLSDKLNIKIQIKDDEEKKTVFVFEMQDIKSWRMMFLWKVTDKKPDSNLTREMFFGFNVNEEISKKISFNFNESSAIFDFKKIQDDIRKSFSDAVFALKNSPNINKDALLKSIPEEGLLFLRFETGIPRSEKDFKKKYTEEARKLLLIYKDPDFVEKELKKKLEKITYTDIKENFYLIKVKLGPAVNADAKPTPPPPPPSRGDDSGQSTFLTRPTVVDTLFVPKLSASLVYNFFEPNEENYEDSLRKDYRAKKLTDIPRYIKLSWTTAPGNYSVDKTKSENGDVTSFSFSEQISRGNYFKNGKTFSFKGRIVSKKQETESSSFLLSSPRTKNLILGGESVYSFGDSSDDSPVSVLARKKKALINQATKEGKPVFGLPEEEDVISLDITKDRKSPDDVDSPTAPSTYIGYTIIKERLRDPESELWEVVDFIPIPDRKKTYFIDTRIAYGESYRYRIRSVFKFVNYKDLTMFSDYKDKDTSFDNNSLYVFTGGQNFKNVYYFDSSLSDPSIVPVVESVRPDPPHFIQIFPNPKKKNILIMWNQKQQQKDVIGFNIFRRTNNSNFQKLNNFIIPARSNFFLDENVEYETDYIYAIESLDAHDQSSKLSFQYSAKLKEQDFLVGNTNYPNKLIVDQNLEFTDQVEENSIESIYFRNKLDLIINPLFPSRDVNLNYLIKVMSIDTMQQKEIKLNFDTNIIIHKQSIEDQRQKSEISKKISKETLFKKDGRQSFSRVVKRKV